MVISGCLLLHFAQIDHAKTSSFCSFQDNNLKIAAQFPLKKNNKSMVFATLSQKRCLKKQTQKHGFSKTPKLPVVDEYLANYKHSWTWSKKPPENKRHTPRGGRRTCYLVKINDTPRAAADARATLLACCCCCRRRSSSSGSSIGTSSKQQFTL